MTAPLVKSPPPIRYSLFPNFALLTFHFVLSFPPPPKTLVLKCYNKLKMAKGKKKSKYDKARDQAYRYYFQKWRGKEKVTPAFGQKII